MDCPALNSDTVFAFHLAHCRDLENHLIIIKYLFTFFFATRKMSLIHWLMLKYSLATA